MFRMPQDLSAVPWPVTTPRLSIRPAIADDAAAVWRIRRIPEVNLWMTSDDSDPDSFAERFADPDRLAVTLVVEKDGALIGDLMLMIQDAWSQKEVREQAAGTQAEIGWVIDPDHSGRGYATEAARALIETCFGPLGLRRVIAQCFADNTASWRVMEKVGMRREDHAVRESLHRSRGWLDGYRYALLADEWPTP
jgi:RimJ/RimL family protein N-acetyltransferase